MNTKRNNFKRPERRAARRAFIASLTVPADSFGHTTEGIGEDGAPILILRWRELVDIGAPAGARGAVRQSIIARIGKQS